MNGHLLIDRSWRRRAINATFVAFSLATVAESLPQGSTSLQIPIPAYRVQTSRVTLPVTIADVVAAEAEETHHRVHVQQYRPPYKGKAFTAAPNYADPVIEADELHADRRSVNLYDPPYKTHKHVQTPQIADVSLPEGSSSQQVPLVQYRRQKLTTYAGVPLEDAVAPEAEETHHRIAVYNPVRTYVRPHVQIVAKTEDQLPEADQSLSIVVEYENRSDRTVTRFFKPEEPSPVEAPELHPDIRFVEDYIRPYRGKTFAVLPQIPEPEPSVDLPEGSSTVQVPIGLYRPQRTSVRNGVPPEDVVVAEAEETHRRISVYAPIRKYFQSRTRIHVPLLDLETLPEADQSLSVVTEFESHSGRTFIGRKAEDEAVVVEAPELHPGRRSVYLPVRPYRGKTYARPPQIAEDSVVEADELHRDRRSINLFNRPYKGQSLYRAPNYAEDVVEAPELHPSRRSVYTPIRPYRAKTWTLSPQSTEPDELISSRRSTPLPVAAKYKSGYARTLGPQIPTEDELLQGRRSAYLPIRPYRHKSLQVFQKPEEPQALPEGQQVRAVKVIYPRYDTQQTYGTRGNAGFLITNTLPDLVRTATDIGTLPHTTESPDLPYTTRPATALPHTTRKSGET